MSQAELALLKEKITELVRENPEKAAILLTEWMKLPKGAVIPHKKAG